MLFNSIGERLKSIEINDLDKATADLEATNKNFSDDEDWSMVYYQHQAIPRLSKNNW